MAAGLEISGTITAGGVAQQVLPGNKFRKGLAIQNRSKYAMVMRSNGELPTALDGTEIPARTYLILPTVLVPLSPVYLYSDTPGGDFTVVEGVDEAWTSAPGGLFALDSAVSVNDVLANYVADDESASSGNAATFWFPNYYTNPGTARVWRVNRLLVGEAAKSSGDYGPVSRKDWLETFIANSTAVSQLTSVNTIGGSGITGAARTSDYRAIFGGATGGSQGVNGFGLNDDTGAPTAIGPIACGGTFAGYRMNGVAGITLGVQISAASADTTVGLSVITPNHGIPGNSVIPVLITTDAKLPSNISAMLVLGNGSLTGSGGPVAKKGIVAQTSALDGTIGAGGGGVVLEMAIGMSFRWLDASDNVAAEFYGTNGGLITPSNLSVNGGTLQLQNGTTNCLIFGNVGTNGPTTTTKSSGEKITLFPTLSATATNYAIGIGAGSLWMGVPQNNAGNAFLWYGGTSIVGTLDGTGKLTVAGAVIAGGPVVPKGYTFATLPSASTAGAGARTHITDAPASPTWGAAAAGGGATFSPVVSTGTAWIYG